MREGRMAALVAQDELDTVMHIASTSLLPHPQEIVGIRSNLAPVPEGELTQGAQNAIRATVSGVYTPMFGMPTKPRRFQGQKRMSM